MVQGRLLTSHPGGVHGGGEAPGGDPPLRQGAGKSSPGAPDLGSGGGGGTEMRSRKRVPSSRVSGRVLNICQRGASAEAWGAQAPPRRGPEGGRAARAPGALVAPLRPYFGRMESSGTLIFYIFSRNFSGSLRNGKTWNTKTAENRNWHWGALS